jgi:hypothetical protein
MIVHRGLALGLVGAVLAASGLGCTSTSSCGRDEDQIDVYGFVNADGTEFTSIEPVMAEAADGGASGMLPQYTYFPPNRSIVFHIGMVAEPTDINVFLSFSPDGDATVAEAAGNQSLIRKHNKDQIVLRNDTCSEFWVWLTASASATPFHQVTDAGAGGSASNVGSPEDAGASGAP